jgi:hypothetical protein
MSAVFAMSATSPVYLRLRKDCGSASNRGPWLLENAGSGVIRELGFLRDARGAK